MKKRLLLGTALLAAISAFPQSAKVIGNRGAVEATEKFARKYQALNPIERAPSQMPIGPAAPVTPPTGMRSSSPTQTINWQQLSGSMNIYGMLVSTQSPLQYNDDLGAVSFIHRKSATYQPSPFPTPLGAETGAIVGMVTADWGVNWDSTCIWNDNTNWARYPQGGLYNSSTTNTSLNNNVYVIATGPITPNAGGWTGNYFASKQLDIPGGSGWDNVASTTPGAQQFIANTAPFGPAGKADFVRLDFATTDHGDVWALGLVANNVNSNTSFGYVGAAVMKGTFNSGVFTWTNDTLEHAGHISGANGTPNVFSTPHMSWNEKGDIGYVWHIGVRATATANVGAARANNGLQPIVWKTINYGQTWGLVNSPDFTQPQFAHVLNHIVATANDTTLKVPFFNVSEGLDGVVDSLGKLHIFSTVLGTTNSHPDSIFGTYSFLNYDGETYSYAHGVSDDKTGNLRTIKPFLYDFSSDGSTWNVTLIDSMGSEAPATASGQDGYNSNPWDAAGGTSGTDKVDCDARLQISRTPDGKYIVYSWAETDTVFSANTIKWNINPDIHARVMNAVTGVVHPTEINVSGGSNLYVNSKAHMYYMSPTCEYYQAVNTSTNYVITGGPILKVPYTVSNDQNVPMTQLLPNTHWYTSANLAFGSIVSTVGFNELSASVVNSVIYPNPAKGSASLVIDLKNNSSVDVVVFNTMGQAVKSINAKTDAGQNIIPVGLEGLSSGIYMVDVKVGDTKSTKKLIVE